MSRRQIAGKMGVFTLLVTVGTLGIGAMSLAACKPSVPDAPPKPPSIEEIKKSVPTPTVPDVKSYTQGKVLRDASGKYVPPWREKTTCDGPNACKSVVINDITGEIALKDGVPVAPWNSSGNGLEITRPMVVSPAQDETKVKDADPSGK